MQIRVTTLQSMVSSGELVLCLDACIFSENDEVLRRPKFHLDQEKVAALLDYVEHQAEIVAPTPLLGSLPDPDDEPFLEVALSGRAEYLITGNLAHYPSKRCRSLRVLSPADFLKRYIQSGSRLRRMDPKSLNEKP